MIRSIGPRSSPVVAGLILSLCLACAALAGGASAQDLQITDLRVKNPAGAGDCNTVTVRVRNASDRPIDERTVLEVITFPTATPFQGRARSRVTFDALRPNEEANREIEDVRLLGGSGEPHTVQAVADATHRVTETNESNNSTTTRPVTPSRDCDGARSRSASSASSASSGGFSGNATAHGPSHPGPDLQPRLFPDDSPSSHPLPRARGHR